MHPVTAALQNLVCLAALWKLPSVHPGRRWVPPTGDPSPTEELGGFWTLLAAGYRERSDGCRR